MRCCATCRGHRSLHWHRSRFPANGAAPRGGRRLKAEALGLAGRDGFAGDAVNPSVEAWPRHPCRGHPRKPIPPGHGQFPCASTTEKKEKIKSRSGSLRYARSEPSMARLWRTSVRGKLSKPGWVGWRGCEPHGPEACLGRVGQDAQPGSCRVRRTAHTSKRLPSLQGRIHGVPRAPNPTGPLAASAFSDQPKPTHEGLRRWLETTTRCRRRPQAPAPSPVPLPVCGCGIRASSGSR